MDWEPFLKNIRDVDKPLLTNLYNELAEFLMHHDGVVNADIGTDIVLFAAVRRLFCAGVKHIEFDGFVKSCSDFFSKYKTCLQRDDSDEWRGTCLYFFCSSYIFEMLNNGKYSIEEVIDGQKNGKKTIGNLEIDDIIYCATAEQISEFKVVEVNRYNNGDAPNDVAVTYKVSDDHGRRLCAVITNEAVDDSFCYQFQCGVATQFEAYWCLSLADATQKQAEFLKRQ